MFRYKITVKYDTSAEIDAQFEIIANEGIVQVVKDGKVYRLDELAKDYYTDFEPNINRAYITTTICDLFDVGGELLDEPVYKILNWFIEDLMDQAPIHYLPKDELIITGNSRIKSNDGTIYRLPSGGSALAVFNPQKLHWNTVAIQ